MKTPNPQAFPQVEPDFNNPTQPYAYHTGMTLRDYFAGQALQGILANGADIDIAGDYLFQQRARTIYALADAMLEARTKETP